MSLPSEKNNYFWKAVDSEGNRIQGEEIAAHAVLLKLQLRKKGLRKIKIRKKFSIPFFSQRISDAEITFFSRELAILLKAGVPLLQSLEMIRSSHGNIKMRQVVHAIKTTVENGSSIAVALHPFNAYFNSLYRNLIYIGEQSGTVDMALDRIATYQEKLLALKSKIKKALLYPVTVISIALVVTIILLVVVVPQFEVLFANSDAELPLLTQVVIGLSRGLKNHAGSLITSVILIFLSIKIWMKKFQAATRCIDKLQLRIPLVGPTIQSAILARFLRTLAATLEAGLPIVEALRASASVTDNLVFEHSVLQVCDRVTHGEMLHKALRQAAIFPDLLIQMVAVGEESGSLTEMLHKLASIFEEKVDTVVSHLSNLLEPLIMVILGVLIGTLIIAMYLPVFKLGDVI